jgi:hypothetical protein
MEYGHYHETSQNSLSCRWESEKIGLELSRKDWLVALIRAQILLVFLKTVHRTYHPSVLLLQFDSDRRNVN